MFALGSELDFRLVPLKTNGPENLGLMTRGLRDVSCDNCRSPTGQPLMALDFRKNFRVQGNESERLPGVG